MKEGTLVGVWRDGEFFITTTRGPVEKIGDVDWVAVSGDGLYPRSKVLPIFSRSIDPSAIALLGAAMAGEF